MAAADIVPENRGHRHLAMKQPDPVLRFQRQICWNSYMAKELHLRQCGVCTVCFGRLGARGAVIHHMDYAHACRWDVSITVRVNNRNVAVPDCRSCRAQCDDRFTACRRRLQLLHRRCHVAYHKGEKTLRPIA
jgi:hypothetical protein